MILDFLKTKVAQKVSDIFGAETLDTSLDGKRERALDAEDLLASSGVFQLALKSMKRERYAAMILTRDRAHSERLTDELRALEGLPDEINRFINDYKMALDKQKKHG